MAADTVISYLMCIDALSSERKKKTARLFISKAKWRVQSTMEYILSDENCHLEDYEDIIDRGEDITLSF
jgi:hypothetical protein